VCGNAPQTKESTVSEETKDLLGDLELTAEQTEQIKAGTTVTPFICPDGTITYNGVCPKTR
jgi:hypothetical protein